MAPTAAVEFAIPLVAGQIKELKEQRATVARQVEAMLEDFPLTSVLMSMPGIGIKTAAQILLNIGTTSTPSANLPRRPGPIFHMPYHHRTALTTYRHDTTTHPHAHYR